jgi:hypothetical protein
MAVPFDPADPFPLLADPYADYAGARAHAAAADAWLGLHCERVEAALPRDRLAREDRQLWLDLPLPSLQTPYVELRALMARLAPPPGHTVVDLGAGYGRLGFVIARHHPGVAFVGYELVAERAGEGTRCLAAHGCEAARLEVADLAAPDFAPCDADIYFLYDYGTRAAIEKTLEDLRRVAQRRPIAVVGRGRASRDAIERGQPWLAAVVAPEHFAHASIYRSRS